jgi:hypothetical protein
MTEHNAAFKVLTVNLQERDLQVGLGVDGRTILELILKKYVSVRELC